MAINGFDGLQGQVGWRYVFLTAATVHMVCGTFYVSFGTSVAQSWSPREVREQTQIPDKGESSEREPTVQQADTDPYGTFVGDATIVGDQVADQSKEYLVIK